MKDLTNQVFTSIITALVTTAIIGLIGYFSIVKVNQARIESLENIVKSQSQSVKSGLNDFDKELYSLFDKINKNLERNRASVDSLKLFVVAAHPERNHISLVASRKLQSFNSREFEVLAIGLADYQAHGLSTIEQTKFGQDFKDLMAEHDLTESDLNSYLNLLQSLEKK